MKSIFKFTLYSLTILLLIFYVFAFFGISYGCAFGSGSFDCKMSVILPISSLVGIFSLISLKFSTPKTREKAFVIFWTAVLVPLIIFVPYYSLPKNIQMKYYEGFQVFQACETGDYYYINGKNKTYLDEDVCQPVPEICNAIDDSDGTKLNCMNDDDRHYKMTDHEACSIIKEEQINMECHFVVAKNNQNPDYCKTIDSPEYSHKCSIELLSNFNSYMRIDKIVFGQGLYGDVTISMINDCKNLSGFDSDICLAEIAYKEGVVLGGSPYNPNVCEEIKTDWIRENCIDLYNAR
jgi:hypothetical protein